MGKPIRWRPRPQCADIGRILLRVALGVLIPTALQSAGTVESVSAQTIRSLALAVDNDGLAMWIPRHRRPDRYYTSGLRIEGLLAWTPAWARLLGSDEAVVCGREKVEDPCFLTEVSLGQEIYTPDFLFDSDPSSHDRPYAGWLYADATTQKLSAAGSTSLSLQVGVTGEPSLASQFHRWFHRSLGKHEPMGWNHQIPFEPAFMIRYEARRAFPFGSEGDDALLVMEPRGSVALGTLRTGVIAGLLAKIGWNRSSLRDPRRPESGAPFLVFVVGAEGEYVMRDLFLDGNFGDWSSPASRESWVARFKGGIQAGWDRFGLEFTATRSTLEFQGQNGAHTYGTFRLIVFS
jgi:lipid A 3-O-deacylase